MADNTGFAANEPTVVAHFVIWLFTNVGVFLIGHTHLFTQVQWDSYTTGLVPIVTAALLSFSAWFWRTKLSPAWKVVEKDISKVGIDPTVIDQIAASVVQSIEVSILNKQAAAVTPVVAGPPPISNREA
jgi:hypothetical protein